MKTSKELLTIENLSLGFQTREGFFPAVQGLSFSIKRGETLAVVGESGCGKSVTAQAINRLLPSPPAEITQGSIKLEGVDILKLSEKELIQVRGRDISMIFQEPMTSLNPAYTIGRQNCRCALGA
jgi:ABC-type microcin C transport system duplicated ATPase subunit YejF